MHLENSPQSMPAPVNLVKPRETGGAP